MEKVEDMSWIDIYLSDEEPDQVYGADAEEALTSMLKIRDLPHLWINYRKSGVGLVNSSIFVLFDIVRNIAYRKGFEAGEEYLEEEKSE